MTLVQEQVDLSALDFAVSCAVKDCDHTADWWNVCLACGAHTPVCEPHRRQQVLGIEQLVGDYVVSCPDCDAAVFARSWRRLFAFVPIGSA